MLHKIAEWSGYIEQQQLPPVDRQRLVDRLEASRRRYMLAAAPLANTPDLGYWLATMALTAHDPDALALVRKLSDARAERRQRMFSTTHTYSMVKDGETQMTTVSSGMSIQNGQVVDQYSSSRLELKPGNCVFATHAFGAVGRPNPGLTFSVVGKAPEFFARCYLNRDVLALPDREGEFVITVPGEGLIPNRSWSAPRPRVWPEGKRYFDFVLGRSDGQLVDDRYEFTAMRVTLAYEYTGDNVVVWVNGAARVRKERHQVMLADSPVFWDRDGAL
jgi:hypothetical protein